MGGKEAMQVFCGGNLSFAGTVIRETIDEESPVTQRGAPCCFLASSQQCEILYWTGEAQARENSECILYTGFRAEKSKARDRVRRNCE